MAKQAATQYPQDDLNVAVWFNNGDNNHNCIAKKSRPPLNIAVKNETDEPITITIAPGASLYLPKVFGNKFANTTVDIGKKKTRIKLNSKAHLPVFVSAKRKS